jgi:hypothetical protein
MQSIRIGAGDNRRMKQLAARLGMSFNLWAVQTLVAELERYAPKEVGNGRPAEDGTAAEAVD